MYYHFPYYSILRYWQFLYLFKNIVWIHTGVIHTIHVLCHIWWDLLINFHPGRNFYTRLSTVLESFFQVFLQFLFMNILGHTRFDYLVAPLMTSQLIIMPFKLTISDSKMILRFFLISLKLHFSIFLNKLFLTIISIINLYYSLTVISEFLWISIFAE